MKYRRNRWAAGLSLLIAVNILISIIVYAEEGIEISVYKANPGYSVNVSVNGENLTEETGSSVTWYVSDTEDGEYTQVPGAAGANWQIFNSCANKYIKACINGTYSNAIKVGDKASNEVYTQNSPIDMPGEVDGANVFKLADNDTGSDLEYILLDSEEYEGENLVLVKKEVVRSGFSTAETTLKFNPDTPDNLGYYLNHELLLKDTTAEMDKETGLGTSYYQALPKNIRNYINTKHIWLTEAGNGSVPNDYTFEAGITVMSRTELMKYKDKLGVDLLGQKTLFRTPMPSANRLISFGSGSWSSKADKLTWITPDLKNNPYQIFPEFYLTDDFFTNVKLDLENTGGNVKKMLVSNYTMSELGNAGYTMGELISMGFEVTADDPSAPTASNVAVNIKKALPGYEAVVSYDYSGINEEGATRFEWMISDTVDGEYTAVAAESENTWMITNACAGKYLKVKVIPVDVNGLSPYIAQYESTPIQIGMAASYESVFVPTEEDLASASKYSFYYSGIQFQMLDYEMTDGKPTYFILRNATLGQGKFDVDGTNKFDTEDPDRNNIGYWLNHELLTKSSPELVSYQVNGGNGLFNFASGMEDAVRKYIDTEHIWLTEAGSSGSAAGANDYTFKAGIVLVSASEYEKYADKIGDALAGSLLRTPSGVNSVRSVAKDYSLSNWGASGIQIYKPAFYLQKDFFLNYHLDIATMGSGVKEFLLATISREELADSNAEYTDAELDAIGYPSSLGYAENVSVKGTLAEGETLAAEYDYNENNTGIGTGNAAIYQWYVAKTPNGEYTEIAGANTQTYTLTKNETGKYIRVRVTPYDKNGVLCTSAAYSSDISVREAMPVSVKMISKTSTGGTVTVRFAVSAEAGRNVILLLAEYMPDFSIRNSWNFIKVDSSGEYSVSISGVLDERNVRAIVFDSFENLRPIARVNQDNGGIQ